MKDIQTKFLIIKKLGWKRVCRNTQRFGWTLSDAVQHDETTITKSYDGHVSGDKIYIDEHEHRSTKTRVHLSFYRRRSDFANLVAIFPLELIYNIIFYARRFIGLLLPLLTIVLVIFSAVGQAEMVGKSSLSLWWTLALLVWIACMVLESILAIIASKILKRNS